jgi:hypothetical protein
MQETSPPPFPPQSREVWKFYLFCVVYLLPSLFFFVFASLVVFPKAQKLWLDAGSTVFNARWLLECNGVIISSIIWITPVLVLLFSFLELKVRGWPRWRKPITAGLVILLNTYALTAVTASAVTMGLAATSVMKNVAAGATEKTSQK